MNRTQHRGGLGDGELEDATRIIALIGEQRAQFSALVAESQDRQLAMAALIDRVSSPDEAGPNSEVEVLLGVHNVRTWLLQNAQGAQNEVISFSPGGGQQPRTLTSALPLDEGALRRGVRQRTLFLTSAIHDANTRGHVEHLTGLGGQFRTAPTLPMRMLVIDHEVALLPLSARESSQGAFLVRSPGTIQALRSLFEAYWEVGTIFGDARDSDSRGLSDEERSLLVMLSEGAEDEEVARRMGISVRTVRRRVSNLSTRLDARSRFQAGANSVRLGWL